MAKVKGFKGFNKDLKCRGFQYKVGQEYIKEGLISMCQNGFHLCENPFDVFEYYGPRNSRYCRVEGRGGIKRGRDKLVVSDICIKEEISLSEMVEEGILYMLDANHSSVLNESDPRSNITSEQDHSTAINYGYRSVSANTGYYSITYNHGFHSIAATTTERSVAVNDGYFSTAISTGPRSVARNSEEYSLAVSSGAYSVAINSGKHSTVMCTGPCSMVSNSGEQSVTVSRGSNSVAENSGEHSIAASFDEHSTVRVSNGIAIATGKDSVAAGDIGSWLVLTERDDNGNVLDMKCVKVDGEFVEPNTYYRLLNGRIFKSKPRP